MQDHISSNVRCCFYHLRSIGKLRPFSSTRAANTMAVSIVLSRLDYCNSCLWGVPSQQLKRLHLVQIQLRELSLVHGKKKHITPVVKELHWLPWRKRIDHKIMSFAYECYEGAAPKYLQELISRYIPARPLRLSSQLRLRIPSATEKHTKKKLGFRAFSNSAPKLWNALPQTNREADSSATFRRRLKAHLFPD